MEGSHGASPKARRAVAEEPQARPPPLPVSSSDDRGTPTAPLDHRAHASDEGKGTPARGGVDFGDSGG